MKKLLLLPLLFIFNSQLKAQCGAGLSEVYIDVHLDDYGYEVYWELVPSGNGCGNGTLFSGGNPAVGCNGGSAQNQTPGGYGNNITVTEGPWCLTDGASYDIIFVDDWGDAGATFTVSIDGYPLYDFTTGSGAGAGTVHTFTVTAPLAYDMVGEHIHNFSYINTGNETIHSEFFSRSANTITSMDYNYQIDNNPVVTSTINSLNFLPFTSLHIDHPIDWAALSNGTYTIKVWASNLNGNADLDNSNDTIIKTVEVGPGIPNIIDNYLSNSIVQTTIADFSDGVEVPRDLDFHPVLTRYELWVILKSTENVGGKTVKISNAGQPGQTSLLQQDQNAWHFMSLPTGIAFSENENFATSPGVYDANHNGGDPFTGPALWSSDPAIYAQPSGGNGSHMDMLHESPYSMGIAHEADNIFWVFDGENDCVTRYDFKDDHGPGNSYHGDGLVRRYAGMGLTEDPLYHISSHVVIDKTTNWLYIVDTGNDRILRLDITSGNVTGTFTPWEAVAESSIYGNYTVETVVNTGLIEPSGVDVIGNRLLVSDHANGDIIIYDISAMPATELGRITTGNSGIMGIKIGPDGAIWYVNATTNEVVRVSYSTPTTIVENENTTIRLFPNPVIDQLTIQSSDANYTLVVNDINGKILSSELVNQSIKNYSLNQYASGVYFFNLVFANGYTSHHKVIVP